MRRWVKFKKIIYLTIILKKIRRWAKFKKLSVAFKVKDREKFLSYVTGKIPGKKFFKDYNKKQVKIMKEFILKMFQHGYVDFKIK